MKTLLKAKVVVLGVLGQSVKFRLFINNFSEMRMLRWMRGLTRRDRVKNVRIRETVKMRWFGHI